MISESLANRYVRALFAVAGENGAVDGVLEGLQALQAAYEGSPDLRVALGNPRVDDAAKKRLLQSVVAEVGGPTLARFLTFLVEHRRTAVLSVAATLFSRLKDRAAGIRRGEVITALPLSAEQKAKLETTLSETLQCQVILLDRVDPTLIGGVAVRLGDLLLDGSLRGRLANIHEHLFKVSEQAVAGLDN